jgi:hypothetical protein
MDELKLAIERIRGNTHTDAEYGQIVRAKNKATGELKAHLELAIYCLRCGRNVDSEFKKLNAFYQSMIG